MAQLTLTERVAPDAARAWEHDHARLPEPSVATTRILVAEMVAATMSKRCQHHRDNYAWYKRMNTERPDSVSRAFWREQMAQEQRIIAVLHDLARDLGLLDLVQES